MRSKASCQVMMQQNLAMIGQRVGMHLQVYPA